MHQYYLIHHHLTKKSKLYQKWHEHKYHEHWYWLVFLCVGIIALSVVLFQIELTFEPMELKVNIPQAGAQGAIPPENLSRGLIALPQDNGRVFLSWRFSRSDSQSTNFNVYRSMTSGSYTTPIATVTDSSNYLDSGTSVGQEYYYIVKPVNSGIEGNPSNEAKVTTSSSGRNYIRIPLARNTCGTFNRNSSLCLKIDTNGCGFDKMVIGDLDGDGLMDYVIRTPESRWCSGVEYAAHPYTLEAYLHDGTFKWQYDTHIEAGVSGKDFNWENSHTVWDMDGDGRAEVMTTAKFDGTTYLVMLNGLTGQEKNKVPWPAKSGTEDDPEIRCLIGIAYLDGSNPAIIASAGSYSPAVTAAYDKDLNKLWGRRFGDGYTAHHMQILDTDEDGRDEILQASNLIDDTGNLLWSKYWYHMDGLHVGDFDPDNPGYEAIMTPEAIWGPNGWSWTGCNHPGAGLIDLDDNGRILWQTEPACHLHGSAVHGDFFSEYRGMETVLSESGTGSYICSWPKGETRVYDAKGNVRSYDSSYNILHLDWDDDDLRDPLPDASMRNGGPSRWNDSDGDGWVDYPGADMQCLVGGGEWQVDIFGDFRQEYVLKTMTDFYIYTNTSISHKKKATPLQDRHYRQEVASTGTGYWHDFHELRYGFEDFLPPPTDSISPQILSFRVDNQNTSPITNTDGSPEISWSVSDTGGSHLHRVEIYRANYSTSPTSPCSETNKSGCQWTNIQTVPILGNLDSHTGSWSDNVQNGTYWYGLHVIDQSGNMGNEPAPIKVVKGSGSTAACTYYASPSGAGNGLSQSSPFQIADFWSVASPGKTLCLLDGTYRGDQSMIDPPENLGGTAGSPITVRTLNDGKVTIDGEGKYPPVHLRYNDYFILEGFNAHSSNDAVVELEHGANNNIVRRVVAWDGNPNYDSAPFASYYGSDNLFEDCAGWGDGRKIFAVYGDTRTTFRRCFFRWTTHTLTGGSWRTGMTLTYYSTENLIENCIGTWDQLPGSAESGENWAVFGVDRSANPGTHRVLGCLGYLLSTQSRSPYLIFGIMRSAYDAGEFNYIVKDCIAYTDSGEQNVMGFGSQTSYTASYLTAIGGGQTMAWDGQTEPVKYVIAQDGDGVNYGDRFDNVMFWNNSANFGGSAPIHYTVKNPMLTANNGNILQVGLSESERPKVNGQSVGAQLQYRYVNGQLTNEPLWPWPMNERIKAAMVQSGYDKKGGLDGKGGTDLTKIVFELGGGTLPPDYGQAQELMADFNCDNQVDVRDFGILLSHWGKTVAQGIAQYQHQNCSNVKNLDLKTDGVIDALDMSILLSCWGSSPGGSCWVESQE